MNPDFSDTLSSSSAEGVEYLLVGGHAMAVHGVPRAAGCVPKKSVAQTAPPPPSPEGKMSDSDIFDLANPALGLPADVQLVRPLAVETAKLPKHPERAHAAHDGPHREIVRIGVDLHGTVSQVPDSPMGRSDGDGTPDYRVMTSWEAVPVDYDIRFRFEIVDGKGVVKTIP